MPSDLVSLADASVLLGVSSERVRQLVVAGDIPGVRFGNAWAVPREAILSRAHGPSRRGRPLSAGSAWEAISAAEVDLLDASRFRNRGERHRFEMSQADYQFLSDHEKVLVGGVEAAIGLGELLSPDLANTHLYLPKSVYKALIPVVASVADPMGGIQLRVVPDEVWDLVGSQGGRSEASQFVPPAAVALDLMESGNPRHWISAENLLGLDG